MRGPGDVNVGSSNWFKRFVFVFSRGLAMLDSRVRPPRTSHKHTLHLCKATLTVCRPDLKAPDLHWATRIFGNPDSGCLQFS